MNTTTQVQATAAAQSSYPIGIASSGDMLGCVVIPTDSYVEGTTSTATSFEIINTSPVASDLEVTPVRVDSHSAG